MSAGTTTDIAIIGAGPAGLAAAVAATRRRRSFVLLEEGSRVGDRSHQDQASLGRGVGGCGLYSDGKFSYFPAATRLWQLADRSTLEKGWHWLEQLLPAYGMKAPPLPAHKSALCLDEKGTALLLKKRYPSLYMSSADRERLIVLLQENSKAQLLEKTRIEKVAYDQEHKCFHCAVLTESNQSKSLVARHVVLATGRLGPLVWSTLFPQGKQIFRRVELGVRLEQATADFFLKDDPDLDPKLFIQSDDPRYSWRTFCCCRDGEIVGLAGNGWMLFSGRGDCEPSGRSNVGFNLRITHRELGEQVWQQTCKALTAAKKSSYAALPLSEYLAAWRARKLQPENPIVQTLGQQAAWLLGEGLWRLQQSYPSLSRRDCRLVGPAVEGVSLYPAINEDLRLEPYPLWVAGDATGIFRGLTAALLSGYYAGSRAAALLDSETESLGCSVDAPILLPG